MFLNKLLNIILFIFWCLFYPIAINYYVSKKMIGTFASVMWEATKAFFSFFWDYIFDRRFRRNIIALWTEKMS